MGLHKVTFHINSEGFGLIIANKFCDWLGDAEIITLLVFVTCDKGKKC